MMMNLRHICCGLALLTAVQLQAQETIKVGSTTRNFLSYAPEGLPYNPPLVISLHGAGQDAAYQRNQTNWEAVADTAKFVVVYPNGNGNYWDISGTSDTQFLETLIDTMYQRHHINRNRVYITGFSMGGMMTYHCMNKLGNKVAAFGPVSGIPVDYRNPSGPRKVPIIHIHGTADNVVYYEGDASHPAGGYGPIPDYVEKWAQFDGCSTTAEVIKPYPASKPGSGATLKRWKNDEGIEVVLISIEGKGHWHSNDENSVHSTREIWNFCKRYSLGPEESEPARLVTADPVDNAFDLTADGQVFSYAFSAPVDGDKATATLAGGGQSWDLLPQATGFVTTLSFVLPQGVTPADGNYVLTLKNVVNEQGGILQAKSFAYTFGVTEVGDALDLKVLVSSDWKATQAQVGEGIPAGWRRVNTKSNGSQEITDGVAANCGGVRMKYFPEGGEFDTGFYLSARDNASCDVVYGAQESQRLHLAAGKYRLHFKSTYWSEGAYNGGATFDAYLSDLAGNKVLNRTALKSEGCVAEQTSAPIATASDFSYVIDITTEGDYLLGFRAAEGWNSVIVGDVQLTEEPSAAERCKVGLKQALQRAAVALAETDDARYDNSGNLRPALSALVQQYSTFASTSPLAYDEAIQALDAAIQALNTRKAAIDAYMEVITEADALVAQYADDAAVNTLTAYTNLQRYADLYGQDKVNKANEEQLTKAVSVLNKYIDALKAVLPTAVQSASAVQPECVEVICYTLTGVRTDHPRGLHVQKRVYADGTMRSELKIR